MTITPNVKINMALKLLKARLVPFVDNAFKERPFSSFSKYVNDPSLVTKPLAE